MNLRPWMGLLTILWAQWVYAAPGDILFSDNFDSGGGCGTLAPNWTTSNTNLGGTSTQTSNSSNCSMFTRGGVVSNTSVAVNLGGVVGADLDVWIRIGADAFSEDPDAGENFVVEYADSGGFWIALETFNGGSNFGTIYNRSYTLPADALHANLQIRFRQTGGSGGPPDNGGIGWDYYHVDDVVITETATPPPTGSSNLGAGLCDDMESGFDNWQTTSGTRSAINNDTFNSAGNSMFLRHAAVTTTAWPFNSAGVASFDVWVRRGADSFSEDPDGGENLVVQYQNNTGTWVTLETFTGSGSAGQIFNRSYTLPATGRHANFRVRFTLTNGSGSDFDYWHVDDVCFPSLPADMALQEVITVEEDPIHGVGPPGPYSIPGAWHNYALTATNNGFGPVDINTVVLTIDIDANETFYAGDFDGGGSPFIYTDGSGAEATGLAFPFTGLGDGSDGVVFRDGGGVSITPIADFDPNVRSIEISFDGQFPGATGSSTPNFTIEYRNRLE